MQEVDLLNSNGDFVSKVKILPYQIPPDAIMWGERFFFRKPDGKFYEGFVAVTLDTQ